MDEKAETGKRLNLAVLWCFFLFFFFLILFRSFILMFDMARTARPHSQKSGTPSSSSNSSSPRWRVMRTPRARRPPTERARDDTDVPSLAPLEMCACVRAACAGATRAHEVAQSCINTYVSWPVCCCRKDFHALQRVNMAIDQRCFQL